MRWNEMKQVLAWFCWCLLMLFLNRSDSIWGTRAAWWPVPCAEVRSSNRRTHLPRSVAFGGRRKGQKNACSLAQDCPGLANEEELTGLCPWCDIYLCKQRSVLGPVEGTPWAERSEDRTQVRAAAGPICRWGHERTGLLESQCTFAETDGPHKRQENQGQSLGN